MNIVTSAAIAFLLMIGIISVIMFIKKALTKDGPKLIKHVNITRVIPNDDTWEKRYLNLVQEIWLSSDKEIEEYSYEEEHKDVIEEIHAMNIAIHEKRRTNETI